MSLALTKIVPAVLVVPIVGTGIYYSTKSSNYSSNSSSESTTEDSKYVGIDSQPSPTPDNKQKERGQDDQAFNANLEFDNFPESSVGYKYKNTLLSLVKLKKNPSTEPKWELKANYISSHYSEFQDIEVLRKIHYNATKWPEQVLSFCYSSLRTETKSKEHDYWKTGNSNYQTAEKAPKYWDIVWKICSSQDPETAQAPTNWGKN